jgi:iron complex transport system permease protein
MRLLAPLALLLVLVFFLALAVGAVPIPLSDCLATLLRRADADPQKAAVLLSVRFPRVVLGMLVGAGLGTAGAAIQGLFRNPLADPGLVGISSGAMLAATFVFVVGDMVGGRWSGCLPAAAFGGALLTAILVHRLAQARGQTLIATMLLAGIAMNALAQAGSALLTFLATDAQIRSISFWRLGSLGGATWTSVVMVAPFILIPVAVLPLFSRALNTLQLGESEAYHLGIHVERVKNLTVVLVAMAAGASVAITGIIGFVGLIVPHLIRLAAGPDYRRVLPGS